MLARKLTTAQQINGRERQTATFLSNLRGFFQLACCRFAATSSQPLCLSLIIEPKLSDGFCFFANLAISIFDLFALAIFYK